MSKQVHITIDTRTVLRILLIVAGFLVAILFIQQMSTALRLIGLSFFLAIALNSSVSFLAKRLPGTSRVLATSISYLAVVAILGVLLFSTIPTMFRETSEFVKNIPQYVDNAQRSDSPIGGLIERYGLEESINNAAQSIRDNSSSIATGAVSGIGRVTDSIIAVVTVLVLTFLMLIEAPRWQNRFWGFYTNKKMRQRHREIAERMYRVVTGYVNGQVAIATIAAVTTLVVLLVLGAIFDTSSSIALPLAGIVFVTGLIPMVGALIGGTLVALFLALNSIPAALVFLVYFIAYQQFENYVIQPIIQSKALELSPLVVFASALLGFYLMGPIGGFVAIPIVGCIRVLLLDYLSHRNIAPPQKREVEQELKEL